MSASWNIRIAALVAASAFALATLPASAELSGTHPPRTNGPQVVKYPTDLQRAGEEGTVGIQVYVTEDGAIRRLRVVRSSGNERLDNAALESVLAWKFNPAEENGHTTAGYATVQVVYKVPEPGSAQ